MEVKSADYPSAKLGPVEYILYEARHNADGTTIYDAVSAEDYEQIYPVLMCCSFPMNTIEDFHRGLFTPEDKAAFESEGELFMLRNKIRSVTNNRVQLLPISRTLYELFYLRQYLYARIETEFATDTAEEYFTQQRNMLLVRHFFFDHNSKLTRITTGEFCDQARAFVLDDPHLCLLHYDLNTRLVEYLKSNVATTIWSSITYQDVVPMIDNICDECELLQKGSNTPLARQFDTWPLTSPALGARMEQMFSHLSDSDFEQKEDELEAVYLDVFSEDIKLLKKVIKTMLRDQDYSTIELNGVVVRMNKSAFEDELYGLLYRQFCPELGSFDLETPDTKTLNKVLLTIDIVDKVDTCVARFRKRGYINRELIKRCIQLEMDAQQEDVCFLYRATNSINEEGNTMQSNSYISSLSAQANRTESAELKSLVPHSLSFGPSLFAGAMHDKTATVYNYLIQQKYAQGYLIKLPKKVFFGGSGSRLFFMPPLPTIVQLASIGELFHPRSKIFIEESQMESREHFVSGILNCSYARAPPFLITTNEATASLKEVIQANRIIIK